MNFFIHTLGCKANQYDSALIAETLKNSGYTLTENENAADIFIVNSCTVTAESDRKTRQALRRFKTLCPHSAIVLAGCMPQRQSESANLENLPLADIVIGNNNISKLPALVENFLSSRVKTVDVLPHACGEAFGDLSITAFDGRTRAYVKIEDGCDRFCSYCAIPSARGFVRSRPLHSIKSEIETLAAKDFKEFVLIGINLCAYGEDNGTTLCDAIETACGIETALRIRLGSLEPEYFTKEVILRLAKQPKLCPHFHLSLQSGCNETLNRMNRRYSTSQYETVCANLRTAFHNCAITTDILVGFNGETESEFDKSLAFAAKIGFAKAHIFPYSVRKGTAAELLSGALPKGKKTERAKKMQKVCNENSEAFCKSMLGKTFSVLFETETAPNIYEGYSENYLMFKCFSKQNLCGKIKQITAEEYSNGCFKGEV